MRKTTLTLLAGAAAIAASGAAHAQGRQAPQGDLTRAEAQQHAAQAFERLDANRDGQLDAADREARHQARFDRLDADGDGAISREEFGTIREGRGDGPRAERRSLRRAPVITRGPAAPVRGLGRNADADSDGIVTRAEFEAAALARFDAVDSDKDGIVTAAERKAHRDGMRQQWRERRAPDAG